MAMNAAELEQRRATAQGRSSSNDPTKPKIEDVVKMFSDDEKVAVLAQAGVVVKLGTPAREFILLPLSLRQMVQLLPKLKSPLGALINLFRDRKPGEPQVPIATILEALVDEETGIVKEIPELIILVLKRGNDLLDEEWVWENINALPDLQTILPHFIELNGLDKLFYNLGKRVQPSVGSSNGNGEKQNEGVETKVTPITALSEPSASSAPTTDGQTTTS